VVSIYMAITAKIPVRNVAVTKDDGGVIELSADKGQLTTRQIATLKSFCRKKIDQQIPPNARRRR